MLLVSLHCPKQTSIVLAVGPPLTLGRGSATPAAKPNLAALPTRCVHLTLSWILGLLSTVVVFAQNSSNIWSLHCVILSGNVWCPHMSGPLVLTTGVMYTLLSYPPPRRMPDLRCQVEKLTSRLFMHCLRLPQTIGVATIWEVPTTRQSHDSQESNSAILLSVLRVFSLYRGWLDTFQVDHGHWGRKDG